MISPTATAAYLIFFVVVGIGFLFGNLLLGRFVRPNSPNPEKLEIYECGEPTIGSSFVQFDLRFYVVALLFIIFDVEVAFFFPWAVVFGNANALAKVDLATKDRETLSALLTPAGIPSLDGESAPLEAETAKSWAWVAFVDILVFFGVLMMGFAYLWRRGDIDWVRSTAAEKTTGGADELPVRMETREWVGSN